MRTFLTMCQSVLNVGEAGRTQAWPHPSPFQQSMSGAVHEAGPVGPGREQAGGPPSTAEQQPALWAQGHAGPSRGALEAAVSGWDLTSSWVVRGAPGSRDPKPRPGGCRSWGWRRSR